MAEIGPRRLTKIFSMVVQRQKSKQASHCPLSAWISPIVAYFSRRRISLNVSAAALASVPQRPTEIDTLACVHDWTKFHHHLAIRSSPHWDHWALSDHFELIILDSDRFTLDNGTNHEGRREELALFWFFLEIITFSCFAGRFLHEYPRDKRRFMIYQSRTIKTGSLSFKKCCLLLYHIATLRSRPPRCANYPRLRVVPAYSGSSLKRHYVSSNNWDFLSLNKSWIPITVSVNRILGGWPEQETSWYRTNIEPKLPVIFFYWGFNCHSHTVAKSARRMA